MFRFNTVPVLLMYRKNHQKCKCQQQLVRPKSYNAILVQYKFWGDSFKYTYKVRLQRQVKITTITFY